MSRIVFTGNHGARGIHIYTMYNTGTQNTVDTGKFAAAMIHQSIDQGSAVMPRGRMNHHSLGFVYYDHILVLIEDLQRNIFRFDIRLHGFRQFEFHNLIRLYPVTSLYRNAVYGNCIILN